MNGAMRTAWSAALAAIISCAAARADEPIADFSPSSRYRATVAHPALTVKSADVARARENLRLHDWAKAFAQRVRRTADRHAARFTPEFVAQMLEPTTPLSTLFTPCPACRAAGKTWHPHGQWKWSDQDPERITCEVCGTIFPNAGYPEDIVVHTHSGAPQTFTFMGGEPFEVFNYKTCRPSLSGCIRSHKVQFMTDACRQLGEAYLLSADERYARAVRAILLRLAEVYPHWLVHCGYGEIVDADARTAAAGIEDLPDEELVYPPNKPDRRLFAGFWQAGRATGHGQEGRFVRFVAGAYDATCDAKDSSGQPIYSDQERLRIERDLLLEATILLTADPGINNKSVGNRAGAAMVGIALGHPGLVRFGLDGFRRTVDEWFLPDGGTPESPGYAHMTFSNTMDLPLAMRGYSDPPGYRDDDGKRLENLDLYRAPAYERAWAAMIDGLQGDCTMVPFGDAYAGQKMDPFWAEILAANYPDRPQYLALLRELSHADFTPRDPSFALYYRDPQLATRAAKAGPLTFPDLCLPHLRIGHMRTGADGRESLLVLSASHWGAHHHQDSLNLYYWKNGTELLSDLGYLWDNPLKKMTARTLAHNTVLIDEAEQATSDRGGDVELFKTSPRVKVMRASSRAYPSSKRYQRTSAIIDHGDGRNYVVDIFSVEGGTTQDFVFHGPNQMLRTDARSTPAAPVTLYDLANVRKLDSPTPPLLLMWTLDDQTEFSVRSLPQPGEETYVGDGWGQRDRFNHDAGATLPYVVRRTRGHGPRQFVSIFEGHRTGAGFVRGVARHDAPGEAGGVTIEVPTADGRHDRIVCGERFSVTSAAGDKTGWTFDAAPD